MWIASLGDTTFAPPAAAVIIVLGNSAPI